MTLYSQHQIMVKENEKMEPPTKKIKTIEEHSKNKPKDQNEGSKHTDFSQDIEVTENKDFSLNDKYTDYVTADELDRLREFKVLDETKSNDEDSNDEDSDSSEGVPDEEIEKMLDENLPEELKAAPKPKEKPFITRQKIVLEEKGVNHIEVLPLDWMMARHYSGMPIYMHRTTRVCTLSKPYFLAKGNVRRHDIPISAIPCLAYRRALEEEEKQQAIDKQIQEQIKSGSWRQYANVNENAENEINPLKAKFPFLNGTVINANANNMSYKIKCPYSKQNVNSDISIKDSTVHENELKNDISNDNDCDEVNNDVNLTEVNDRFEANIVNNECVDGDNVNDKQGNIQKENNKIVEGYVSKLMSDSKCKNYNNENTISKICKREVSETNLNVTKLELNGDKLLSDDDSNEIREVSETNSTVIKSEKDSEVNVLTDAESENEELNISVEISTEVSETSSNVAATQNSENNETETNKEKEDLCTLVKLPTHMKPVVLPGGIVMPPPRVETVATSWKTQHLTHEQVNEYCKNLFKFKTINIMHFKRWADRRKYTKARKTLQYPTLPEGTKLITIPVQNNGENGGKSNKRDWVMNMDGRSYLSVFHEYVCRVLQKQPVYEFKQLENAASPYQATVLIGGMQYGVGTGTSKRAAKSAAARASIHVLIPEMRDLGEAAPGDPDCTFFDYVGIEDPRVSEFCAAACEPSPYAVLRTCLLRNFGAGDRHIHTQMKKLEYQEIELTMRVGKHSSTVVCKNKKTAKQRASQAILQALHPQVRSWGSLLRLYGSRSLKSCKEKKMEEQQITLLQDSAKHNEPNYAVLEKLRNEMKKLRERDDAVIPIGTLLVTDDLPTHSGSNLNNVYL